MNLFTQLLEKQQILILDGALGTELQKRGYDLKDKLWSAKFLEENPQAIAQIHEDYLKAGADILITASYQASIEGFMAKGMSYTKAKELIQSAIFLAQEVRDSFWDKCKEKTNRIKPLVAASIGPYGAFLADGSEYSGDYKISDEELKEFHKKRLEIIIETKPDILACETLPSFKEAQILCELLKEYNTPCWISFSAKDDNQTNAGDSIKECAQWFEEQEHISAIGINCTAPCYISSLIKEIKNAYTKPIVVYPNGGSTYNPITKQWQKSESNEDYAKLAHLWFQQGAQIIGGCCQTTPKEIEDIAKWVRG